MYRLQKKTKKNNILAIVTQSNQKSHTVNLQSKTCTCGRFQANSIPCSHVSAFLENLQELHLPSFRPHHYIPKVFQVDTWYQTYSQNILPISISKIPVSHQIAAPTQQQNKRGRPKIKRFLPGSSTGSHACRKCGKCGHNRRTCQAQDQLALFAV